MSKIFTLIDCIRVISEPGDATRYDFIMQKFGDDVKIMPCENTFMYPQTISKWDAKAIAQEKEPESFDLCSEIADTYNCNPHTVMEVCKCIWAYWGGGE